MLFPARAGAISPGVQVLSILHKSSKCCHASQTCAWVALELSPCQKLEAQAADRSAICGCREEQSFSCPRGCASPGAHKGPCGGAISGRRCCARTGQDGACGSAVRERRQCACSNPDRARSGSGDRTGSNRLHSRRHTEFWASIAALLTAWVWGRLGLGI